jgi:uncharacterized protein (AIM24 family)
MSTLVAQTISNGTVSTSSANVIQGSAKAWVNFNGTGTVAIRSSFNVSSITDNGTGDYTVNFTTAMPNANYAVAATSTIQAGVSNAGCVVSTRNTSGTTPDQTTSGVRIITIGVSSPAEADVCQVNVSIFS